MSKNVQTKSGFTATAGTRKAFMRYVLKICQKLPQTNISDKTDSLMLNAWITYVKRSTHLCSPKHILESPNSVKQVVSELLATLILILMEVSF